MGGMGLQALRYFWLAAHVLAQGVNMGEDGVGLCASPAFFQ